MARVRAASRTKPVCWRIPEHLIEKLRREVAYRRGQREPTSQGMVVAELLERYLPERDATDDR